MRLAVSIIFFVSVSFAQFENNSAELPRDTLAKVGSHIVSAGDFIERFELMPWPKKEQASRIEFTKLEFLYSLVAEKLLAIEASAQNIGGDSASLSFQHNLERMFVRDELYKQEALPNISISETERTEGMRRLPIRIEAEVLGIISRREGELLRKKLLQSKNKNATLKRFTDSLFVPLDTLEVTFGYADQKIEDALFSLNKDTVSSPMEIDRYGLVMFRLLQRTSHAENSRLSIPDRLHKVENIIKKRKEDSLAARTFADITSPQRAEADPAIFLRLADSILSILKTDSTNYQTNGMYKLPSSALNILESQYDADRSKIFITIASGNMTIGDVLQGLGNNNVLFPSLKLEHIRTVLNNNIKTVIQNELIAREGMKRNLQQSKNVRNDVAKWLDNRKSWILARTVLDSVRVSDDEIESEYQKHPHEYGAVMMVRLQEILVDSLRRANEIRERLANGEQFPLLAQKYSKRREWAIHGGESPWFDVSTFGELGLSAASAEIGEIRGPLKIREGFSVYSVIERKVIDDSVKVNYGTVKVSIMKKLLTEKKKKTLDNFIGTLAKKYSVAVNESALRKIKTTTTSMITWRNIGFGGRIIAVPQMVPQTDWVSEWQKKMKLNQ
jgi:hypothetical protein